MTVEIDNPEDEALIQRRHALACLPHHSGQPAPKQPKQNLADFLLNSPLRRAGITIERTKDHPTPIDL